MYSSLSHSSISSRIVQGTLKYKRAFLPMALLCLIIQPTSRDIVLQALSDAFLQVTMFVAATLYLYYFLVKRFPQLELSYIASISPKLEVPFAAFLGALPGCGGAIIVVTQYTKRQASFGSLVAVLIATMGDAAFLLLATAPKTALLVLAISFVAGSLAGLFVNYLHPQCFLAPEKSSQRNECNYVPKSISIMTTKFWSIIAVPMFALAVMIAFQVEFEESIGKIITLAAAGCALVISALWAFSSPGKTYQDVTSEDNDERNSLSLKVLQDTHFVTSWVIAAFVLYEISVLWLGLDIAALFKDYALFMPLIACLVGLLPGCGPQIIVTTLYIQGFIPFSALIANAISNDGDALFPAIALVPKAAVIATLYTAIPSLLIGYAIYFY